MNTEPYDGTRRLICTESAALREGDDEDAPRVGESIRRTDMREES